MVAHLRDAELANVVYARSAKYKAIAVLIAYLDESGTHKGSPAVGVVGLIGSLDAWERLEPLWAARLAQDDIKTFHAFDCLDCRGEYADMIYWNQARKDSLFGDLGRIVERSGVGIFGMQVAQHTWREAFKRASSPYAILKPPASPYLYCFEACIELAVQWSEENAGGEPIALVFANHEEYAASARKIADAHLLAPSNLKDRLTSLTFATPDEMIPLQAADLVSFEFYRFQAAVHDVRLMQIRPILYQLDGQLGETCDVRIATAQRLRAEYLQPVLIECPRLAGHLLPFVV